MEADSDPRHAVWRPGVRTELRAGASLGSEHFCVFEQEIEPGKGAPLHRHPGVSELLYVLRGTVEFVVDQEPHMLEAGESFLVEPSAPHSFSNVGRGSARLLAVLSDPEAPAIYDAEPDVVYVIGGVDGEVVDATRVRRASTSNR